MFRAPQSIPVLLAIMLWGCVATSETDTALKRCEHNGKVTWCSPEKLCCQGECIDHTDENCGACGKACREYEYCGFFEHKMACLCQSGMPCTGTCCYGLCVELSFNPYHCGICGNTCATGQPCVGGVCNCPPGFTHCDGSSACTDMLSDSDNCGACGHACPDAGDSRYHLTDSFCAQGTCDGQCAAGYQDADGDLISNGCELSVYTCGNSVAEPGESCDGTDLRGYSCQTAVGLGSTGALKCKRDCTFDLTGCSPIVQPTATCGNNIAEPGELCDGKDIRLGTCEEVRGPGSAGTPGCNATCSELTVGNCSAPILPD